MKIFLNSRNSIPYDGHIHKDNKGENTQRRYTYPIFLRHDFATPFNKKTEEQVFFRNYSNTGQPEFS